MGSVLILFAAQLETVLLAQSGSDGRDFGKWIFAGVFALLIVWLVMIPAARIGQRHQQPPWWRNVRYWAIAVAAVQMMVYVLWG